MISPSKFLWSPGKEIIQYKALQLILKTSRSRFMLQFVVQGPVV